MRKCRLARFARIGVLLAACASELGAQVRPDSLRRKSPPVPSAGAAPAAQDTAAVRTAADSVRAKAVADSARNAAAQARIDSIAKFRAADTIKVPLGSFETPLQAETSDRLHFTRAQLLSAGAVNLADLLDRVPGVTTYRTGWLAGLHTAAYQGDFRRVRVFVDGIERDAVEPRNGGILDLNDIPIWTLDDVVIERTAGEVRVWLRGWSVRKTIPYTRVDIFTGDLNTNALRALYARRFANGMSVQFVGQQVATQSGRVSAFTTQETSRGSGDGSQQMLDLRIGWARGKWSADVQGTSNARDRDVKTARTADYLDVPRYRGTRRDAMARVMYGDTLQRGWWAQAIAGAVTTRLDGVGATGATDSTVRRDTLRSRTQHLVAVGYRGSWWHASLVDRMRPIGVTLVQAPSLRLGAGTAAYRVEAVQERRGQDSLSAFDIAAIAKPLGWLQVVATHSQRTPDATTGRPAFAASRVETAVRVGSLWFSGGMVREGASRLMAPGVLGTPAPAVNTVPTTGVIAAVRGPLYKAVSVDVQAVRWDVAQYYRPQLSVRTDVGLSTNWLSRFPKGQFSINAHVIHEARDPVPFQYTVGAERVMKTSAPYQLVTGLLELRIQSATIFYQYRNLTGTDYEQVPGILMPPGLQFYGVRWEFSN